MDGIAGAYAALADQPRGTWILVAVMGAGIRIWMAVLLGDPEKRRWVRWLCTAYGRAWGWLLLSGVATDVWHTMTDERLLRAQPVWLAVLIVVGGFGVLRDVLPDAAQWFRYPTDVELGKGPKRREPG